MTKHIGHSTETDAEKTPITQKPQIKPTTGEAPKPRRSIFDASYAPVGSELRKAWSRHNRKS
ncbi:hypothetical protein CEW89_02055 [Celeribacter ethanolicus]|uniref:Uncharacterized protein n=1 Tax=Celeribacter ethanolicus TaxID=1758178 RepID=A0A291G8D7_9RHOB|nr:hypothetical protein [Celeribacter ethanolicus]ATG46451.1 hypothetical protein CEW89_02055 [Celeribacter ethanolicus]